MIPLVLIFTWANGSTSDRISPTRTPPSYTCLYPLTDAKKIFGRGTKTPSSPDQRFFSPRTDRTRIPNLVGGELFLRREDAMPSHPLPDDLRLESLEVGASPLVRHFLNRLDLQALFAQHLPARPGRQPELPTALTLTVLLQNMPIERQPLYAIPAWVTRRVPEHLNLLPEQVAFFNDDRIGRALDHFYHADRASLLTALVVRVVREFGIDTTEFHQDTTTITFSGDYANQPSADQPGRPPWITFGYNKDHRPDLKQLLYSVAISADGAVPVHAKTYDGNTSDDKVHVETWSFLKQIVGHPDFLYVADSKLCSRENMSFIATQKGRFLTVMPRTRNEADWFCS